VVIELPTLYPHQEAMRDKVRSALAKHRRVILCAPPGCHAPGQGIMLHSGRIVKVEDVVIGDMLMGPDSKPRRVLRVGGGIGEMYRIIPTKGDPWVVNLDHILTIVMSANKNTTGGQIIDVSLREWMTWSNITPSCFGHRLIFQISSTQASCIFLFMMLRCLIHIYSGSFLEMVRFIMDQFV
jgi:hypothetical protein